MALLGLIAALAMPAAAGDGGGQVAHPTVKAGQVYGHLKGRTIETSDAELCAQDPAQAERLSAQLQRLYRWREELEGAGDELVWLEQQRRKPTPRQQELLAQLARQAPGIDPAKVFFAPQDSALAELLREAEGSALGWTFVVQSQRSPGNAIVLWDDPADPRAMGSAAPRSASERFQDELNAVVAALHEAFHQGHSLRQARDDALGLGEGGLALHALVCHERTRE